MPRSILFSLPVHERPDIVEGQIVNIARHCPGAAVAIHVSPVFTGDIAAFKALEKTPGVFVNPTRLPTALGKGLFHVHAVNFLHGMQCRPETDTIAFISSNELFVRGGLADYMAPFQAGAQIELFDPLTDWHLFHRGVEREPHVQALLAHLGLPAIFGGQAEGLFFPTVLFAEMVKLYLRFFGMDFSGFETEEILPQTMLAKFAGGLPVAPPFTLQNYCHRFEIDRTLIERVRAGRGFIFAQRNAGCLRSPHVGSNDLSSVFSVKRVPREDCELRRFILQ